MVQESLALASMVRDDPPASSTASGRAESSTASGCAASSTASSRALAVLQHSHRNVR